MNYLFKVVLGTVLATLLYACAAKNHMSKKQEKNSGYHIYLLMGQSNMAGRGVLTDEYRQMRPARVLMLDDENKWVQAKHPIHFDKPKSVGVGPGLSFAEAIAGTYSRDTIALVPCAVGGTSISKWEPGAYDKATDTHPYDDALERIKEAQKKGVIKGIIWMQGEGDSNEASAKVYLSRITTLIKRLRKEIGDPHLPFVAGELGRYRERYGLVNAQLAFLPSHVPYTEVVSSEGLTHKGDGTHLDSPSAEIYGRRFAEGMLHLQRRSIRKGDRTDTLSVNDGEERNWEVLFDGGDPRVHWRSRDGDDFPKEGWEVKAGILVSQPGRKGTDIMTRQKYADFEFIFEFKLTDSANTGIKYFVVPLLDKKGKTTLNGPEYQLIDDFGHPAVRGGKSPETTTGSLYLLYAPEKNVLLPTREWNAGRIIAKGKQVEHWLNGVRILSYERGGEDFRKRVAGTKFKEYVTPYGEAVAGYISLQYHNDQAFFRNIKIRKL